MKNDMLNTSDLTLTSVPGLIVGQATDLTNMTGCTAILCPEGAVAGVQVCGFATGSREIELLRPEAQVEAIHGLVLAGGSAFGLAAANGVVRWLKDHGYGLQTLYGKVPIVSGAVIFDLNFNRSLTLPDEAMGYLAAATAGSAPVAQGNVGAGTGATCGKLLGFDRAMKSGLGSAGRQIAGITVAAVVAINPLGNVVDQDTGQVVAGARSIDGGRILDMTETYQVLPGQLMTPANSNTVICVVATDATLTKVQANRVARMSAVGIARAVKPAHMTYDGDLVFTLATGRGPAMDENIVGAIGAEVLARAIVAGAKAAQSVPDFPACQDM